MLPELELELKSFEMLRSLLDELQKQLMRAPFAASGLLLLGIGWFASEDVAAFLKEHPRFAWIVVLALVVGSVLYCYSAWRVYKRWQKIAATLRYSDVTLAEIYQGSAVSRSQFFVFSGGVVLLAMDAVLAPIGMMQSTYQQPLSLDLQLLAATPITGISEPSSAPTPTIVSLKSRRIAG
jgi:hypothetical protein